MLSKIIVNYISTDCVIADLDIFKSAQSNWGLQRHHRRCEGGSQVDGTYTGKQFLSIFPILSPQYPDFYFWKTAGRVCCSKCCWLRHWRQILRAQGFQLRNQRQLYLPDIYVPKQHDITGSLLSS